MNSMNDEYERHKPATGEDAISGRKYLVVDPEDNFHICYVCSSEGQARQFANGGLVAFAPLEAAHAEVRQPLEQAPAFTVADQDLNALLNAAAGMATGEGGMDLGVYFMEKLQRIEARLVDSATAAAGAALAEAAEKFLSDVDAGDEEPKVRASSSLMRHSLAAYRKLQGAPAGTHDTYLQ